MIRLILILFFLSSFACKAQHSFWQYSDEDPVFDFLRQNVRQYSIYAVKPGAANVLVKQVDLTALGQKKKVWGFDLLSGPSSVLQYHYIKDTLLKSIVWNDKNGKKVREYTYLYAPFSGKLIRVERRNGQGKLLDETNYFAAGSAEVETSYNYADNAEDIILHTRKDSLGKVVHRYEHALYRDIQQESWLVYEVYDERQRLLEKISTDAGYRIVHTYDSLGRITRSTEFNLDDGKEWASVHYSYSKDRKDEIVYSRGDSLVVSRKTTWLDANRKPLKIEKLTGYSVEPRSIANWQDKWNGTQYYFNEFGISDIEVYKGGKVVEKYKVVYRK